jgi:hypothetical protein
MTGKISTGAAQPSQRARPGIGEGGWIGIATAFLCAASLLIAPGTVRVGSLLAMLPFAAILAFVAVGQTVVIQQRGLDMSVVALVALGGVMAARIGMDSGSVLLGVVVTLGAAAVLGAINGFLVARLNIMPIVATLASNAVFLGIVRMVSGNMVGITPDPLKAVVTGTVAGIPATVVIAVVFVAIVTVIIRKTPVGRNFVIVGAAPRTARPHRRDPLPDRDLCLCQRCCRGRHPAGRRDRSARIWPGPTTCCPARRGGGRRNGLPRAHRGVQWRPCSWCNCHNWCWRWRWHGGPASGAGAGHRGGHDDPNST